MKIVLRTARACGGKLSRATPRQQRSQNAARERVELQAGLNVLTRQMTIDEPDFYNYEARFEPDKDAGDVLARNNQAGRLHADSWQGPGAADRAIRRQIQLLRQPTPQREDRRGGENAHCAA